MRLWAITLPQRFSKTARGKKRKGFTPSRSPGSCDILRNSPGTRPVILGNDKIPKKPPVADKTESSPYAHENVSFPHNPHGKRINALFLLPHNRRARPRQQSGLETARLYAASLLQEQRRGPLLLFHGGGHQHQLQAPGEAQLIGSRGNQPRPVAVLPDTRLKNGPYKRRPVLSGPRNQLIFGRVSPHREIPGRSLLLRI